MAKIRVGLTMRPEWLGEDGILGFLEQLCPAGLQALEFELDPTDPSWPRYQPLMALCRRLGLTISLHAPFRAAYSLAGFAGERREAIERALAPLLELAAQFAPAPLVVHPAESPAGDSKALQRDTVTFVHWLLERYGGLQLVLENLEPRQGLTRVATSRADLQRLVEQVGDPRVGICWDLGHDLLSGSTAPPDRAWLQLVRHVHLHDVDEQGGDHQPLMYGRVPRDGWLRPLAEAGYAGTVILEVSRRHVGHLPHDRLLLVLATSLRLAAEAVGHDVAGHDGECAH